MNTTKTGLSNRYVQPIHEQEEVFDEEDENIDGI